MSSLNIANFGGKDESKVMTLSTGYKAIFRPVSTALIQRLASKVEDPPVPTYFDENKGREVENPLDPDYARALDKANEKRGLAVMDALIQMGVELVDPIPVEPTMKSRENGELLEAPKWLWQLKKLGTFEIEETVAEIMEDELLMEFVFKRYIAVGKDDLDLVRELSVDDRDVEEAEAQFRGKTS